MGTWIWRSDIIALTASAFWISLALMHDFSKVLNEIWLGWNPFASRISNLHNNAFKDERFLTIDMLQEFTPIFVPYSLVLPRTKPYKFLESYLPRHGLLSPNLYNLRESEADFLSSMSAQSVIYESAFHILIVFIICLGSKFLVVSFSIYPIDFDVIYRGKKNKSCKTDKTSRVKEKIMKTEEGYARYSDNWFVSELQNSNFKFR